MKFNVFQWANKYVLLDQELYIISLLKPTDISGASHPSILVTVGVTRHQTNCFAIAMHFNSGSAAPL